MAQREAKQLPPWGYQIMDLNLTPNDLQEIRTKAVNVRKWDNIFLNLDPPVIDPYRLRSSEINLSRIKNNTIRHLEAIAHCFDPRWIIVGTKILKSLPDGQKQQAHQDITEKEFNALKEGQMLGSFIIPLNHEAKLTVYNECFEEIDKNRARTVFIPLGYVIIFRGDLYHAGESYSTENYRLHGYLKYEDTITVVDEVEITKNTFKCEFCPREFNTRKQETTHEWLCKKNPAYRERLNERNSRRKQKISCPECD
jgi:hypothetical protein